MKKFATLYGYDLNVRNEPSTADSVEIFGLALVGDKYEVFDTYEGDDYTWYQIVFEDSTGWIANYENSVLITYEQDDYDEQGPTIKETNKDSGSSPFQQDPGTQVPLEGESDWTNFSWIKNYRLLDNYSDPRRLVQMNRFHLLEPDGVLGTKAFIFMTKPDMNLRDYESGNLNLTKKIRRFPYFNYINNLPPYGDYIMGSLQSGMASKFSSHFLSIITNCARGYTPLDSELDALERGETFHGHKIMYAKHNFKSEFGGVASIQFQDTRDLPLYLTVKTWREYIHGVTVGYFDPVREYILRGQLDYAVSMYYVVTKEDMEEIVYWEKLEGLFPLNVPDSLFDYKENEPARNLSYSINFQYSMREVMNPIILGELNYIYHIANDQVTRDKFLPNFDKKLGMHGQAYVSGPYISTTNGKYYLRWV